MKNNQKIVWLLILQGWAMLWVVIGHSGPSVSFDDYPTYALHLWYFAYSFHMPLFIMISGFLFYLTRIDSAKWTYWLMMKEKLIRFGIPFLVFTIFAMVLKSLFPGSVDRAASLSIREFIYAILYPYNGPMREFWFLGTILWMFALYPLWKLTIKHKWLSISVLIGLTALNVWHPQTHFLAIQSVCAMAIYFYAGILSAKMYKQSPGYFKRTFFAPVIFLGGVVLYVVGRYWNIPIIAPLGGTICSLAIALWLEKLNSQTFNSFRNYTYQIYLIGIFFNVFCTILRAKVGLPFAPMQVVSLLLGLYMPVFISRFLEWINLKPLLLCVGLGSKRQT